MSIIDLPAEELSRDNVPDLSPGSAGEYLLRIDHVKADIGSKPGSKWEGHEFLNIRHKIMDASDPAVDVSALASMLTPLLIPSTRMKAEDPDLFADSVREYRKFCEAHGIELTGTDPEKDWVGQEAWAILKVIEDDQYGRINRISQFSKNRS